MDIVDLMRERDNLLSAARGRADYLRHLADTVESGALSYEEIAKELRVLAATTIS
ncbi:hypothetical protein SEA_OREGANO_31 [Gordonia phage Oregano]|nr:hypothetical protein SEA_OREGANO_31 [Gordonia phage Oregano]